MVGKEVQELEKLYVGFCSGDLQKREKKGFAFKITQLQTVEALDGSNVVLPCSVSSETPLGPVKWYKKTGSERQHFFSAVSRENEKSDPRVTWAVENSPLTFSIKVAKVRVSDTGDYSCEKYKKGVDQKAHATGGWTALIVRGVFSVTQSDILQVKIKLGESFTFPETIPQEVFLKFGHSLKTLAQITNWTISRIYMDRFSERVQVNRAAHFLTLTHLRREDSGIYQLESVTGDEFIKTYNITVYMPVSPPKVSSVLSENGSCVLSCSVENHTQATVFWLPGDVALTEKSPFINILLVKIKEADKQYTCVAENPFSKENITVTTDEICARKGVFSTLQSDILHVKRKLGDSFTFPQKIPQDGFLRFGHFVTLSTVALISNWNISRLYTDKFLGRLQVDSDDRSLTITHLRLEDSGIYQLEDVTGDKFTKNYNLTVYVPVPKPKVISFLFDNGSCSLFCSVENDTEVTVFWQKGGNSGVQGNIYGNMLLLEKQEAEEQYMCVAENPFSKENITVTTQKMCKKKDEDGENVQPRTHYIITTVAAVAIIFIAIALLCVCLRRKLLQKEGRYMFSMLLHFL
ncbi:SLAF5 protein, partial [Polypterus senegalus]